LRDCAYPLWPGARAECTDPSGGLGVARTVEIDASTGPIFGAYTKQTREPSFLNPKEVVLTFDDGPMPWITKSILDTLDKFCTKATFFSVGKMALAYPDMVKEVLARGHTLGSHTYSHPLNIARMKPEKAEDEIERGLAAVATAAGQPVAPFFRFPGLSDSSKLLGYLQSRRMAAFTVDAVSNDSYIHDKQRLIDHTLKEIAGAKGGIVLFHDIKTTTARALPEILAALKARGYSIVHMRPKDSAVPLSPLVAELAPKLAATGATKAKLPFYGATGPEPDASRGMLEVTSIAPEPKDRNALNIETKKHEGGGKTADGERRAAPATRTAGWASRVERDSIIDNIDAGQEQNPPVLVEREPEADPGWVTRVRPRVRPTLRRSVP
jgi:peptidoglycan-N-acetylglucosamine deacetylase